MQKCGDAIRDGVFKAKNADGPGRCAELGEIGHEFSINVDGIGDEVERVDCFGADAPPRLSTAKWSRPVAVPSAPDALCTA